jgi:thioredoxin 1
LVRDAEEQIVALQLVLDGKVKIAGFDIDSSPRTPAIFKIMSVPTLMFFKGGEPVDTVIGLQPKQALKARIEKLLS